MTSGEAPVVSVIVVNYDGCRWLDGCLSSLAAQEFSSLEVIVVDNHSSDKSVTFIRERFSWVRVLELDRNVGFAAGNNAGARLARGRLLAFLNNDTEADCQWVAALKSALDANVHAGLATSRVVYLHDPTIVDSAGDGYARWGGAFKHRHGQSDSGDRHTVEVFGACGAACMIRREVFDVLGGFDEDLFLVYEDVDLSYRAQLRDYRCIYVPDARVRHAGSGTMGTLSRTAVFYGQRNLEWVYLKNTPLRLLLWTLPGHAIYALAGGLYLAWGGHFGSWLAAKWAACAGIPTVIRKRRIVQRSRSTDTRRLWNLMERRWFALKWREKKFDMGKVASR